MNDRLIALSSITVILIAILLISACTPEQEQPPQENKSGECSSDADCITNGCSGQLCVPESKASGIITTCEYKEEYRCLKLTNCGCVEGKCAWATTEEYESCITDIKNK